MKQMWMGGLAALMISPSVAMAQVRPGNIEIDAGGAKGEIILDGFPTGIEAPGTLESVPPGEHMIQIEYGCFLAEGTVLVETEETVKASLTPDNRGGTGTIRLRDLPRGAQILLDDAPVERPEEGVEAACGARRLVVESPGYEAWEELVVVTTGKWTTVEPELVEERIADEPPPARPEYDDYDDYDELDEELGSLDGPDEYEMAERRREDEAAAEERRRREEEERAARERARREAEERERREAEAREARFGDIDSLDEGPEEDDDRGRGRGRDRDEDDRPVFDDLDDLDDELDDDLDDFDDFGDVDELDEVGREMADLDDRYGGLDDEPSGRGERPQREKKDINLPLRGIGVGAGVAVLGTGIGVAAAAQPSVATTQALIDTLVANGVTDGLSTAQADNRAAKGQRTAGIVVGVAGVGVGAASWFFLPAMDRDADLLVVPLEDGGAYGELTIRF
jgi:hypothetical protein